MKRWYIHYYEHWNLTAHAYIDAPTRLDALKELRKSHNVVEIICCREI